MKPDAYRFRQLVRIVAVLTSARPAARRKPGQRVERVDEDRADPAGVFDTPIPDGDGADGLGDPVATLQGALSVEPAPDGAGSVSTGETDA